MTRVERRARRDRRRRLRAIIRRDTPSRARKARLIACAAVLDGESEWIAAAAARCQQCPICRDTPCDACLAGGVCDNLRCTCDDYLDDPEDIDDILDDDPFNELEEQRRMEDRL